MNLQTRMISTSDELEKFYSEKFYFSYSGINKLLFSPRFFYNHYILKQKEDKTDAHLVAGRAAHCLLLEPDRFNDMFILLPGKIPTDSNKVIIDNIFINNYLPMQNDSLSLEDFSDEILNQLLTVNLYQNLTDDKKDLSITGDSKRLEKILTENNREYFTFLKLKENKTVIDSVVKQRAEETVEMVKADPKINALLAIGHDNSRGITVYNELLLTSDLENHAFGFKGIVDNVVIDENTKTVFINDLKLTSKLIQDFPESVDFYRYDIQATIYQGLIYDKFIANKEDAKEWTIVFTFVVVDKYNQVYPFQVSNETLAIWENRFHNVVNSLDYHYNERDYTLPYELALGNLKL